MTRILLRAAGLAGVYLLVLTSLAPGDVLIGAAARARRRRRAAPAPTPRAAAALRPRARAAPGCWRRRPPRWCAAAGASRASASAARAAPGFVEIPRGDRTRRDVALWGVLTGEAPDEIVVDVDEERDVLVVHLVDAGDPDAVRARHARTHERWRGEAVR